MGVLDGPGMLDPFFYCTHYADLKGFSAREARRHYRLRGRREARSPNAAAMLLILQAQQGDLPPDFDGASYLRLNADLQHELRHSWQPAEHYLRTGRLHGRRYKPPPPAAFVDRSSVERLRQRLVQAFGGAATDTLVTQVHRAAALAARSGTPAAFLMDPVLLGRWFLSSPEGDATDFADLRTQLTILLRIVFELTLIVSRTAVEVEVLNHLRRLAINSDLFEGSAGRPGVTLLMLGARAISEEPFLEAPTPSEADGLVARFFTRDVQRMAFERYVTPHQRATLREPAVHDNPTPLAARLLEEVEGAAAVGPSQGGTRSFLEYGVWFCGMDYVLSAEQLDAVQLQVVSRDGGVAVSSPDFLFSADAARPSNALAAQAWLKQFIETGREKAGLPQTIVGASAAAYACTGAIHAHPSDTPGRGKGRKPLRVGDLVTFGFDGAGPRHLIGSGWHPVEVTHVWTARETALLAINLEEDDRGPLDLFMRLSPGPKRDPLVCVRWNGRQVGALRTQGDRQFTFHCHLGAQHRGGEMANILCLSIDELFKVETDERNLGVALYDLMLVRR